MNISCQAKELGVILLSVSLLSALGCDIFDSEELTPIEGNIIFTVQEGYQDYFAIAKPQILMPMATEKIYPCINFDIVSDISHFPNMILTEPLGIYEPDICFTALGPARSEVSLPLPSGTFHLLFRYRGTTDGYWLTVSDSYIRVVEEISHFTRPEFNLWRRYPRDSFAYLCGTTDDTRWICEDFLDSLLSYIDLAEFQFPDSGHIPYPCSSAGHVYEMPARYFCYGEEEDFIEAGRILETYTEDVILPHQGVSIMLIGWNNRIFRSWLFDND